MLCYLLKTDSPDNLCKKSSDYSDNCNKNKSVFKEEENNALADFRKESCYVNPNQLPNNKVSNQFPSSSMKTVPNLREEHCFAFVNVHKTSSLSKSYLRQVQTTVMFKSLKELMKQQKTKVLMF